MSKPVGVNFPTRIPEFTDDASIEEALKVYHFGVDNYTSGTIPVNSIEGHFSALDTKINLVESTLNTSLLSKVDFISKTLTPNIIVAESVSTVPLTIRAIASQTSNLQVWQNSLNNSVGSISTSGYFAIANYVSIGSTTPVLTTALNINIISQTNKGIVVKGAGSQSANLQEWQNSAGTNLAWVDSGGSIYSRQVEVSALQHQFFLMGA